jgi:hypothetical protein
LVGSEGGNVCHSFNSEIYHRLSESITRYGLVLRTTGRTDGIRESRKAINGWFADQITEAQLPKRFRRASLLNILIKAIDSASRLPGRTHSSRSATASACPGSDVIGNGASKRSAVAGLEITREIGARSAKAIPLWRRCNRR